MILKIFSPKHLEEKKGNFDTTQVILCRKIITAMIYDKIANLFAQN
jgi:hypothetical protein